jgi:hypothetical protein
LISSVFDQFFDFLSLVESCCHWHRVDKAFYREVITLSTEGFALACLFVLFDESSISVLVDVDGSTFAAASNKFVG